MGRGSDVVLEVGAFRVEVYGSTAELMERRGGYRLPLLGRRDRESLRKLLDQLDAQDKAPVLALVERGRTA